MKPLILGDNLEVLKKIDNESVDLFYLEPPSCEFLKEISPEIS